MLCSIGKCLICGEKDYRDCVCECHEEEKKEQKTSSYLESLGIMPGGKLPELETPETEYGCFWVAKAAIFIAAGLAACPDPGTDVAKAAWQYALMLWKQMPAKIKENFSEYVD